MALFKIKSKPINYTSKTAAFILRRRQQLLTHAYIYYDLNKSLISDKVWDDWAEELIRVQNENPLISKQVDYHREFKGFDASTGFNLKVPANLKNKAEYLVKISKELEYES